MAAIGFSVVTIGLIARLGSPISLAIPLVTGLSLITVAVLLLRGQGVATALCGGLALGAVTASAVLLNASALLGPALPWVLAAFAVIVVFGVARHILVMAAQSLRRSILNQHVLLEAGGFAGLIGGTVGLGLHSPGYPTAAFFAVSVLIVNYHIFSEFLSLLVKTRNSQSVRRLLDPQPDTAPRHPRRRGA